MLICLTASSPDWPIRICALTSPCLRAKGTRRASAAGSSRNLERPEWGWRRERENWLEICVRRRWTVGSSPRARLLLRQKMGDLFSEWVKERSSGDRNVRQSFGQEWDTAQSMRTLDKSLKNEQWASHLQFVLLNAQENSHQPLLSEKCDGH